MGVPKLGLLLPQNFGCSYFFQIKFVLRIRGQYLITLQKVFFNGVSHVPIKPHLTFAFKGFMFKSQIPNLTSTPSFDHNSCKLGLNKQCEGTLSIYASRNL
jgi:hypothetical protein